jgi:hypothetical protein
MDIVYLLKNNPENNSEELRYSLRSLKNIPHNKVVIVGEKPDWVTNVTYIPVAQSGTKNVNVANNLRAAVTSDLVANDFLLMNDDFFFMKKISEMPNLNLGLLKDVIQTYDKRYPEGSDYIRQMKNVYRVLIEAGHKQPLSYELHMPMILNKQKATSLFEEVATPIHQFRTYYGNYVRLGGVAVPDVKIFLEPKHNDEAYTNNAISYLDNLTFLSVTGGSFNRGTPGDFVKSKLHNKSIYEL